MSPAECERRQREPDAVLADPLLCANEVPRDATTAKARVIRLEDRDLLCAQTVGGKAAVNVAFEFFEGGISGVDPATVRGSSHTHAPYAPANPFQGSSA